MFNSIMQKEIILDGSEKYFSSVETEGKFLLCRPHTKPISFRDLSTIEDTWELQYVTEYSGGVVFRTR